MHTGQFPQELTGFVADQILFLFLLLQEMFAASVADPSERDDACSNSDSVGVLFAEPGTN